MKKRATAHFYLISFLYPPLVTIAIWIVFGDFIVQMPIDPGWPRFLITRVESAEVLCPQCGGMQLLSYFGFMLGLAFSLLAYIFFIPPEEVSNASGARGLVFVIICNSFIAFAAVHYTLLKGMSVEQMYFLKEISFGYRHLIITSCLGGLIVLNLACVIILIRYLLKNGFS